MKKRNFSLLLGVLLSAISFSSCYDDYEKISSASLIGSWQSEFWTGYEKYGEYFMEWENEKDTSSKFTFNEDGTFILDEGEDGKDYGQWTYKEDTLYIEFSDGELERCTIKKLTDKKLILEFHEIDGDYEYFDSLTLRKL
ncbi:MAG: lipocalin family protein [Coprobacter sp.]|nr:lipocalin family protein [Coprobacter sp.]